MRDGNIQILFLNYDIDLQSSTLSLLSFSRILPLSLPDDDRHICYINDADDPIVALSPSINKKSPSCCNSRILFLSVKSNQKRGT